VVYDFGGNQMNKSSLRSVFLTVGFAVFALAAPPGCARSKDVPKTSDADAPPVAVSLVAVKEVKTPRVVTLSGTLVGAEEAAVAAGAAGKVIATYVERGSVVKKGALLARLDARAVGAQAAQAAADLEGLRVQAAQSKLDCERTEKMFEKGAISKADYDRTHTQCEASKWTVSSAEARRSLTAEALKDTEIRAPFAGMVVERAVSAGEYVRPDSRVATLVDVDSLRVEITVPEADVPNVKQGMQVDFRTTAGADGPVHHGKIRYVGPSVRRQSRDAVVEAVFDNAGHDLRPGMFVTAKIALGEQTLPTVPATAVRAEGTLRHVFVAVGGRLEDRLVQAADANGAEVPIVSGLKAGEEIVASLTADVRDGMRVK
jgi:membrane fusion protein, multidrug efflux system